MPRLSCLLLAALNVKMRTLAPAHTLECQSLFANDMLSLPMPQGPYYSGAPQSPREVTGNKRRLSYSHLDHPEQDRRKIAALNGSPRNSYIQARRPPSDGEPGDRYTVELPTEQRVGEGVFQWKRRVQPDDVDFMDPTSGDRVTARCESQCF